MESFKTYLAKVATGASLSRDEAHAAFDDLLSGEVTPAQAIDIVGTGGDHSGSYNISTLASIIVASCGVPVAKHGNRAASSKSGTADVLAALGLKLGRDPEGLERCLEETKLCFMFAQT